jgi:hypothetical protein
MNATLPPSEPDEPDKGKGKVEDDDSSPELSDAAEEILHGGAEGEKARDRCKLAESVVLDPGSLVGSFFLRLENGEIIWDGMVVAEPQAGQYLLSVRGLVGALRSPTQVVWALDRMVAKDEGYEFRFYDTREAMLAATAEYLNPITEEGGE